MMCLHFPLSSGQTDAGRVGAKHQTLVSKRHMRNRFVTAGCSLVFAHMIATTNVFAQCGSGYLGLGQMLPQGSVAHVFSGKVARVDRAGSAETVIFDVDRVWKGDVRERTIIYKPIALHSGGGEVGPTVFERGERYVVIAHRLSVAERRDLGLVVEAFGTNICEDGSRAFSLAERELAGIGPGRPPIQIRGSMIIPSRKTKDAEPVYPADALAAGIRGTVIVEITVGATGKVSRARVLRSIPLLDQAAIDCVMKWEYTPTLINEVPQPVTVTATVTFTPPYQLPDYAARRNTLTTRTVARGDATSCPVADRR
jgi:TonB family protein